MEIKTQGYFFILFQGPMETKDGHWLQSYIFDAKYKYCHWWQHFLRLRLTKLSNDNFLVQVGRPELVTSVVWPGSGVRCPAQVWTVSTVSVSGGLGSGRVSRIRSATAYNPSKSDLEKKITWNQKIPIKYQSWIKSFRQFCNQPAKIHSPDWMEKITFNTYL